MSGGDASWLVLEPGADVLSSESERVGTVVRVLGYERLDIFHGLSIDPLAGAPHRFVPAARVTAIWTGRVQVDVPKAEIGSLEEITEAKPPRIEGVADHAVRRLLWPRQ